MIKIVESIIVLFIDYSYISFHDTLKNSEFKISSNFEFSDKTLLNYKATVEGKK